MAGSPVRPVRLQLRRTKGFDLQALSLATNGLPARKVDRSTRWGNLCSCKRPYGCPHDPQFERDAWEDDDGAILPLLCCVDVFEHYVETGLRGEPTRTGYLRIGIDALAGYPLRSKLIAGLSLLVGHNLACWCPLPALGEPDLCHAAVLLRLVCEEIPAAAVAGEVVL